MYAFGSPFPDIRTNLQINTGHLGRICNRLHVQREVALVLPERVPAQRNTPNWRLRMFALCNRRHTSRLRLFPRGAVNLCPYFERLVLAVCVLVEKTPVGRTTVHEYERFRYTAISSADVACT